MFIISSLTNYLETGSQDPCYNLAFEETVLARRTQGDYLLLWQNDNTIVIGQNQNAEAEINRTFVEGHHIHVVRRTTGGGAVYHDLGNLNYSFITDAGNAERLTMERFTKPIVEALKGLGLNAEASGRNDILVEGRKVSGTAQRLMKGRILHHGTLLFDANPGMVAGALNADPAKFQSKGAKSVRSRIGNIREFLPEKMSMTDFWNYLKTALAGGGLVPDALTTEELAAVETLKRTKYDTWEWNFGRSPHYDFTDKRRFEGGTLEPQIAVEKGHISNIVFYGDFLSVCPLDELTEALKGCAFRREDAAAVLDRFPLAELFGGIQRDEILDTMFRAE
ncbi:lipoate--protein ligase [Oscillibacter ruminantium]|uniref:lipoate--protein ligase n=1 Tax=Oscillibacter ruminantium TaxID=1263547 RepID=UPI0002DBF727|nr:lipoate--protein ligase [Oscillibacter ruminantium]MDN0032455.1 lipoate--protein ligase [Oscillibacter valericigenes]MEA5041036.1 lipoate--protein ligase [Oscillibacter ruminantium]